MNWVGRVADHKSPRAHLVFRAGVVVGEDEKESSPPQPAFTRAAAEKEERPEVRHYAVRPVSGTIWLFPGSVPHAVLGMPSCGPESAPRISVAANFRDAAIVATCENVGP